MIIGTLELTFEILNVLLYTLTDFGHVGIEPSYNPIYVFVCMLVFILGLIY